MPPSLSVVRPAKRRLDAVSVAQPDDKDLRSTVALESCLAQSGSSDPAILQSRSAVFEYVAALLSKWVRDIGIEHGLSEEQANDAGSAVLMLGSCALGVPGPGSDIDLVAVVPYFVERETMFSEDGLVGRLRAVPGLDTGSLHPISDAFVPIVKFGLQGVPVDLLLARLRLPQIPPQLKADSLGLLASCIEEKDVYSLNGARVADAILDRVPDCETFRTTLRAVKLWASRRGISQQSCGFPGGIAWALLTARVCQLHPNAAPATLLAKFFLTWSAWRFGDGAIPVYLNEPKVGKGAGATNPSACPAAGC